MASPPGFPRLYAPFNPVTTFLPPLPPRIDLTHILTDSNVSESVCMNYFERNLPPDHDKFTFSGEGFHKFKITSEKGFTNLLTYLSKHSSFKHITFQNCCFEQKAWLVFTNLLPKFKDQLKRLEFVQCQLDSFHLNKLNTPLCELKGTLTHFKIVGNKIAQDEPAVPCSDANVWGLKFLSSNRVIKELILNDNLMGDEGIIALAEVLDQYNELETIQLDKNRMTYRSARPLVHKLWECRCIKTLSVQHNRLKNDEIVELFDPLRTSRTPEVTLFYQYNEYTSGMEVQLMATIPVLIRNKGSSSSLPRSLSSTTAFSGSPIKGTISISPPKTGWLQPELYVDLPPEEKKKFYHAFLIERFNFDKENSTTDLVELIEFCNFPAKSEIINKLNENMSDQPLIWLLGNLIALHNGYLEFYDLDAEDVKVEKGEIVPQKFGEKGSQDIFILRENNNFLLLTIKGNNLPKKPSPREEIFSFGGSQEPAV